MDPKIKHLEEEYHSDTECDLFQYFFKTKKKKNSNSNQHLQIFKESKFQTKN